MRPLAQKVLNGTCSNVALEVNEACLNVYSTQSTESQFYSIYDDCYVCEGKPWGSIKPNTTTSFILQTLYPQKFYYNFSSKLYCTTSYNFEDFGVYGWNITDGGCDWPTVEKKPESIWLNLIIAAAVYLLLLIFYISFKVTYKSQILTRLFGSANTFAELQSDLGNPEAREGSLAEQARRRKKSSRINSIDCFRGIAISIMIFVNYGGGRYSIFKHKPWNGLTIADLVFPWFVWLMGFSIALSLRSQLRTSVPRRTIFCRILRRTLILLSLGILINSGKHGLSTNLVNLRLPGVLQRLGLSYFIVGSIEVFFMKPQGTFAYGPWLVCQDLADSWMQWILVGTISSIQILVTFLLPVPGCPKGYLGPGGMEKYSKYENCTGGASGYVDRLVFGPEHIYQHPTSEHVYYSHVPYDPEGILGLFTSVLLTYLGVHAARIMYSYHQTMSRVIRWLAWGLSTGIIAGYLCDWNENNGWVPINKNLWSISYVLACASISFFIFALLYIIIDQKKWWSGSPFIYPGMNAILLYIGHELLSNRLPFSWQPVLNMHLEVLGMNLYATSLWVVFSYFCYRCNFFLAL